MKFFVKWIVWAVVCVIAIVGVSMVDTSSMTYTVDGVLAPGTSVGITDSADQTTRFEPPETFSAQKRVDVGSYGSLVILFLAGSLTTFVLKKRHSSSVAKPGWS